MIPNESKEDLCRSLERIIAQSVQDGSEELERKWYFNARIERLVRAISRLTLIFSLGTLQGFDLTCVVSTRNEKRSFTEKWRRFMQLKTSPRLYFINVALLSYFSIFAIANLYFQYIYDINSVRLEHIRSQRSNSTLGDGVHLESNGDELAELEFESRARTAHSWLKFIGSAHLEWSFDTQIIYLHFWTFAWILSTIGPVYMKLNELDYFSWVRWLFDATGECRYRAQMILIELDSLKRAIILSAQVRFHKNRRLIKNFKSHRSGKLAGCRCNISGSSCTSVAKDGHVRFGNRAKIAMIRARMVFELDKVSQDESAASYMNETCRLAIKQLDHIALQGRLNPLNKSRAWLFKLALLMPILFSCLLTYAIFIIAWGYHYLAEVFASHNKRTEFISFWDYQEAFIQLYLVFVTFGCAIPTQALSLLIAYDQMVTVRKLKQLILKTIERSEIRYCRLVHMKNLQLLDEASRKLASNLIEALEQDLLTIIVQYRLFIREYKLAMRQFTFNGILYLWAGLSMGVFGRSHGPYMIAEARPLSIYFGYVSLATCYTYLLPHCEVQKDCLVAYKLIYNLVSQAIQFELLLPEIKSSTLKFSLMVLRCELIEPQQAISKFTLRILTLDVTYQTMLQLIVWVSLIVFPMLNYSSESGDGLVDNFLKDPLGIFNLS